VHWATKSVQCTQSISPLQLPKCIKSLLPSNCHFPATSPSLLLSAPVTNKTRGLLEAAIAPRDVSSECVECDTQPRQRPSYTATTPGQRPDNTLIRANKCLRRQHCSTIIMGPKEPGMDARQPLLLPAADTSSLQAAMPTRVSPLRKRLYGVGSLTC